MNLFRVIHGAVLHISNYRRLLVWNLLSCCIYTSCNIQVKYGVVTQNKKTWSKLFILFFRKNQNTKKKSQRHDKNKIRDYSYSEHDPNTQKKEEEQIIQLVNDSTCYGASDNNEEDLLTYVLRLYTTSNLTKDKMDLFSLVLKSLISNHPELLNEKNGVEILKSILDSYFNSNLSSDKKYFLKNIFHELRVRQQLNNEENSVKIVYHMLGSYFNRALSSDQEDFLRWIFIPAIRDHKCLVDIEIILEIYTTPNLCSASGPDPEKDAYLETMIFLEQIFDSLTEIENYVSPAYNHRNWLHSIVNSYNKLYNNKIFFESKGSKGYEAYHKRKYFLKNNIIRLRKMPQWLAVGKNNEGKIPIELLDLPMQEDDLDIFNELWTSPEKMSSPLDLLLRLYIKDGICYKAKRCLEEKIKTLSKDQLHLQMQKNNCDIDKDLIEYIHSLIIDNINNLQGTIKKLVTHYEKNDKISEIIFNQNPLDWIIILRNVNSLTKEKKDFLKNAARTLLDIRPYLANQRNEKGKTPLYLAKKLKDFPMFLILNSDGKNKLFR